MALFYQRGGWSLSLAALAQAAERDGTSTEHQTEKHMLQFIPPSSLIYLYITPPQCMHPITTRNRDIPVGQKPSGKVEKPSGEVIPDGHDRQE